MPNWELSKQIETKLQTTCFYLIQSFFEKQKEILNLTLTLNLISGSFFY